MTVVVITVFPLFHFFLSFSVHAVFIEFAAPSRTLFHFSPLYALFHFSDCAIFCIVQLQHHHEFYFSVVSSLLPFLFLLSMI